MFSKSSLFAAWDVLLSNLWYNFMHITAIQHSLIMNKILNWDLMKWTWVLKIGEYHSMGYILGYLPVSAG